MPACECLDIGVWASIHIRNRNVCMPRFVMNAMLALGGCPWTVIRLESRDDYLAALDRASIDADIAPSPIRCAGR
jgi:hypothetical protein